VVETDPERRRRLSPRQRVARHRLHRPRSSPRHSVLDPVCCGPRLHAPSPAERPPRATNSRHLRLPPFAASPLPCPLRPDPAALPSARPRSPPPRSRAQTTAKEPHPTLDQSTCDAGTWGGRGRMRDAGKLGSGRGIEGPQLCTLVHSGLHSCARPRHALKEPGPSDGVKRPQRPHRRGRCSYRAKAIQRRRWRTTRGYGRSAV
jgi:hypothetical protein